MILLGVHIDRLLFHHLRGEGHASLLDAKHVRMNLQKEIWLQALGEPVCTQDSRKLWLRHQRFCLSRGHQPPGTPELRYHHTTHKKL